jgi:hypothetical protein
MSEHDQVNSDQEQSKSDPWYYKYVPGWENHIGNGDRDAGKRDPNGDGYVTPAEAKVILESRPALSDLDRAAFDHDISRTNAVKDKDLGDTVKSDIELSKDATEIFYEEVLLYHATPDNDPGAKADSHRGALEAGLVGVFGVIAAAAAVVEGAVSSFNDAVEGVSSWFSDFFNRIFRPDRREEDDDDEEGESESPVVLDIDQDGIELVSATDSKAYFDLDGDGIDEKLGWISGGDAILVFDSNQSGSVDDRIEFAFVAWKEGARTDLEGLSHFDTDGDGHLSSADAGSRFSWDQFMIWKDANGNGVSEQGELVTLKEAGIVSIGLDLKGNASEMNGNIVHQTTTFRYANGSEGTVGDVSFAVLRASLGNERSSRQIEVARALAMQDAEREGATLESVSVSPAAYDLVLL